MASQGLVSEMQPHSQPGSNTPQTQTIQVPSGPTIISAQTPVSQQAAHAATAAQFVQVATRQVTDLTMAPGASSGPTVTVQTTSQAGQVSQQSSVPTQQPIYQSHVQYVPGPDHHHRHSTIYANGAIDGTAMYTQGTAIPVAAGTYFTTQTQGGTNIQTIGTPTCMAGTVVGSTVIGGASQLIGSTMLSGSQLVAAQPGRTYVVQGHPDGDTHPLTHTTRASPATVQWLYDNYETAEGVSLPRSTLYNHYLRHCQENKLDPVNAASFGKLIRSVFLGLRTRRLGTRGNSKYHYYGIRIKSTSPLNQYQDDCGHTAMRQQPINSTNKRFKTGHGGKVDGDGSAGSAAADQALAQTIHHQQYLGDATQALTQFEELEFEESAIPEGCTNDDVKELQDIYREHCENILNVVMNLQFNVIENVWQEFWRSPSVEAQNAELEELEKRLTKTKLIALCKAKPVQKYIKHYDHILYQGLVELLIPAVLRPIPSTLTQAIRNFAKSLEGWLKNSMVDIPPEMVNLKIGAVTAFAQTLRRYTSLNHLAQAARAVLQNTSQINQMLSDLNRVDFANVQEQASWVCQCEDELVQHFEQDFKQTLQQQNSLEQWAAWLESVVTQVLKPHENSPNFAKAARQFLLKWSFYNSMVIRDLTLRSAASFGSFHLIRLLYDEYMFYLIEHRVATAAGETPIAVMDKVDDRGERIVGLANALDDDTVRSLPKLTKDLQNIKAIDASDNTAMTTQSNGTVDTS
ncbi:DNA-binding protein RFX2-like isoform X2 [Apostichopus japonicus]|uniref:DNA-binding protein RFX2-like isoform X2 n=1 Tax=Stichopus japonicus TaxID=307972 RepID=UPI003AB2E2C3